MALIALVPAGLRIFFKRREQLFLADEQVAVETALAETGLELRAGLRQPRMAPRPDP